MKFKILPEVHAMRIKGRRYMAGSVVDLPESYRGTTFLQEIIEPAVQAVAVAAAPAQEGSTKSQGESRSPPKKRTRRVKQ